MSDYQAKFIIASENRIKEGLQKAEQDLNSFNVATEKIGEKIKNALSFAAVVYSFEKLGKAAFDCFKEFGEAERRIQRLQIALGGSETAVSRMEQLIGDLKKQTLASKDQIEDLVGELAMLGKSESEIEKISRAAVNLSNVTGQDLNSAFMLINGTFTGTAGRLERLIPEIGNLSKEQLAAGVAVDLINTKFGEMSRQLAENNIPQKIKNITDNWSDLKENLGETVAPLFNPIIEGINRIIEGWNNATKASKLHADFLTKASYNQKIIAQEGLVQIYTEQLRLFDQANSGTIAKIKKSIEDAKRIGDTQTRMMLEDALAVLEGKRKEIVQNIITAEALITDLKKAWAATPVAKLNPGDLVKPVALLPTTGGTTKTTGTTGGGTAETPGGAKPLIFGPWGVPDADYERWDHAVDVFSDDVDQMARYYAMFGTPTHGQSGITPPVLGAGGASIREQVLAMIDPNIRSLVMELQNIATGKSKLQLLRLDTGAGERFAPTVAHGETTITSWGGRVFIPRSDFAEQIAEGIGKIDTYLSDAADALSPADSAWSKRYQAAYAAWDEQIQTIQTGADYTSLLMDNFELGTEDAVAAFNKARENLIAIKEYWEQNPLTGADLARSLGLNELGKRGGQPLPQTETPPQWQPPMTLQEEALGLAYNQMGMSWLLGTPRLGQSAMTPEKLGAGGASIQEQVAAMSDQTGFFEFLKSGFTGAFNDIGQSISGIISGFSTSGADLLAQLTGALGPLASAIQPLMQIFMSANPILAALIPIIQAAAQYLSPIISQLLAPLMGILQIIGQTLGAVLAPILQILSPIIELVGKAFVWLYNHVIRPIANGLIWIFTAVQNAIAHVINAFSWLTGISVQYASYEDAKLQKIEYGDVVQAGANAAGATAAQSANYRSQSITINIYQEAPVVGSGGMTEFARIIRGEFERLGYYGA